jgi:hypothetical protein
VYRRRQQSRLHRPCLIFKKIYTTCMAQKLFRRRIFVKAFGRYLCKKILKTLVVHHAGWSIHTDACPTRNKKRYAISAVRTRRHSGWHKEQNQSMVGWLSTSYEDWRWHSRNSQLLFQAISGVWIEASSQQVCVVVCNHSCAMLRMRLCKLYAVLWQQGGLYAL